MTQDETYLALKRESMSEQLIDEVIFIQKPIFDITPQELEILVNSIHQHHWTVREFYHQLNIFRKEKVFDLDKDKFILSLVKIEKRLFPK